MCPTNILSSASQNKLQTALIVERDENVKKGIAVALMNYFAEIIMTDNLDDAIKLSTGKDLAVIIAGLSHITKHDADNIKRIADDNPKAKFLISLPDINEVSGKLLPDNIDLVLLEKPIDLNTIIKQIENVKSKRSKK
jgi:DNA-binding NtrC family response regulator